MNREVCRGEVSGQGHAAAGGRGLGWETTLWLMPRSGHLLCPHPDFLPLSACQPRCSHVRTDLSSWGPGLGLQCRQRVGGAVGPEAWEGASFRSGRSRGACPLPSGTSGSSKMLAIPVSDEGASGTALNSISFCFLPGGAGPVLFSLWTRRALFLVEAEGCLEFQQQERQTFK